MTEESYYKRLEQKAANDRLNAEKEQDAQENKYKEQQLQQQQQQLDQQATNQKLIAGGIILGGLLILTIVAYIISKIIKDHNSSK